MFVHPGVKKKTEKKIFKIERACSSLSSMNIFAEGLQEQWGRGAGSDPNTTPRSIFRPRRAARGAVLRDIPILGAAWPQPLDGSMSLPRDRRGTRPPPSHRQPGRRQGWGEIKETKVKCFPLPKSSLKAEGKDNCSGL